MTKVTEPLAPHGSENSCPNPLHVAPFQPSPYESIIERVHVVPGENVSAPAQGLPPWMGAFQSPPDSVKAALGTIH